MDFRLSPPGLPADGARLSQATVAERAAKAGTDPRTWLATRKAAEEFEGQFVSQMLGHMFSGIETDGPFGGGHAEETFRGLLVEQYGKQISRAGGAGLADAIQAQMLRLQEV